MSEQRIEGLRTLHTEPHEGLTESDVDELFEIIDTLAAERDALRAACEPLLQRVKAVVDYDGVGECSCAACEMIRKAESALAAKGE